ncbi:type IV pilus secretin PilQ family protein [Marinobacter nauticus]|uniref:Type IV pilus assembly protein PilQ n=1 Tax=Marinobacter nauticus TaxID=2743 RepID=A0A368USY9_MARNT|nr:type IV pilus secretin PilQ family protein [Marinobacter nauticus]RBP70418.1 type IV pilus assembly protein PilQ [Marinobacter nauticus]RCW31803.1 type IV pilus assembly protein PilQ [Marinobacter nauticus]
MNSRNMHEQTGLGSRLAMFKKLNVCVGVIAIGLWSGLASAVTLQDLSFSSLPGERLEVTMQFDGTPPEPSGYTIERPARIAVDLKDTTSALNQRSIPLGTGNAQSVTVVETKDRTRLIFNLVELVPHDTVRTSNSLVMTIGGESDAVASTSSQPAQRTTTASPASSNALAGVDFRRGKEGEGRVIVDLGSSTATVNLNELGGRIRLTMPDLQVPADLRRRLDVTDFATPVTRIDTFVEDGSAVVEIRPQGEYDYIAYQSGREFTVSIEELSREEAEARREEKFPYTGDKLSLNFQDIEVRSVLQLIADFTGLNLVASDTVGGSITLRLQNVPWDQALDLILKTKGLDKRQIGNVLLVAPAEEIAAREKLELETNKQIAELAPVRLDIIQVNYAKASDVVSLIQADSELISSRGFVSSDARTNTISVRETSEKLEEIRRLVSTWDVPVRQVSIEARIVRAQNNVSEELGVKWGFEGRGSADGGTDTIVVGGSQGATALIPNSGPLTLPSDLNVDLGVTRTGSSSVAFGYIGTDFLLDLELSAFESDGRAEVVSQPRVVTADRQTASIKSGEEIPYQEATSSGATNVEFKEAVLSLEVTPQITPDDKIIMDLVVNQDSRGEVTAGIPSINTNEVTTQVLVANGETVVLGGIFQSEVATQTTKTPFLGDIPYLGRLFKRTEHIDERSELLIFITPKIIKNDILQ